VCPGSRTPATVRCALQGVRAIGSADDLAHEGVFDTDEELDAVLAHVYAMRHADLA